MPEPVFACLEPCTLPTYPVGTPEKNPMFFEKRVYQGSSGRVYPVPFIDRVGNVPRPVTYRSARLENEFVRLVLLPEIGGRLLIAQDKANRDYDFFYRQDVIKPALVGLAGPWISGGVELNWPQHHRPGTFLPCRVFIEEEPDGSRTVWMGDHEPLNRMQEMHGFRLRPGSALIELRVRLFNRSPFTQTFLWWANVAARVHDQYQSFFPPDVHYVADHAVRAQSSFPIARNPYYGVRYDRRPGANDLTWYRNTPVPTSYMVCETKFDFFGGYDYAAKGGFVHVANRHIAPGKKQWTWGDHPFGHAWDRELTDAGGPYIELMAGVYTDNQPDFSYLAPHEVRTFSQYWWPLQQTGPVQCATERAGLRLVVGDERRIEIAVAVPAPLAGARIRLSHGGRVIVDERRDLDPASPFISSVQALAGVGTADLELKLLDAAGRTVLAYRHEEPDTSCRNRAVAVELPPPGETPSTDELFLNGEHLKQYRHATRSPEAYWNEALARDPGDARAHLALGRRRLRRGEYDAAAAHLQASIARLTANHPNPVTGEAHYHLGLTRRWQDRLEEAYAHFYKAAWDYAWRAPSFYELAAIDCRRGDVTAALAHLELSLDCNRLNNQAHALKAVLLRKSGRASEAETAIAALLASAPLDPWGRSEEAILTGGHARFDELTHNDAQVMLDIAFDYADAGVFEEAIALLRRHHEIPTPESPVPNALCRTPSTRYALAWMLAAAGRPAGEIAAELATARGMPSDYFFPSRLHEQRVLEWAIRQPGADPLAHHGLGNCCYDQRRHADAIAHWEQSVAGGAAFATPHRNLGVAYWNVRRDAAAARAAYERALALDRADARLVYEYDQLCRKLVDPLPRRLAFLEAHRTLVLMRDDAAVELASLYNLLGRPEDALVLLTGRRFHPWEGGEGSVLREHKTARLLLGRRALADGNAADALVQFGLALESPPNLGEAHHLLQAKADANYWLGCAHRALGCEAEARAAFDAGASECGDFSETAVTVHSALSYHRGCALRALGREEDARRLFGELQTYGETRIGQTAQIDYFATSLPNLLVFEEDLQARRDAEHHLLAALGAMGLGDAAAARRHLAATLEFTNTDHHAASLARELVPADECCPV